MAVNGKVGDLQDDSYEGPSTEVPASSVSLEEQSENYWHGRSAEERQGYLEQLNLSYHAIVDDFLHLSSTAVESYQDMVTRHLSARRRMIWMSGAMAIANIVVSVVVAQGDSPHFTESSRSWLKGAGIVLPGLVAVYAALIAVFSNLESLENHLPRAQTYRQARESSLNAFRELEMLWHVYVRPFSDTPAACVNAANLYRRAVTRDQEVRGQIMEKTQRRPEPK
jgi:hypothetical protein